MKAELPYSGTSGWGGSESSRDRAEREDGNGITSQRQQLTIRLLWNSGSTGLTVQELSALTGWHHGQASGALSVLQKTGNISRIRERRNRCEIYLLPQFVKEREVSEYKPKKTNSEISQIAIESFREELNQQLTQFWHFEFKPEMPAVKVMDWVYNLIQETYQA